MKDFSLLDEVTRLSVVKPFRAAASLNGVVCETAKGNVREIRVGISREIRPLTVADSLLLGRGETRGEGLLAAGPHRRHPGALLANDGAEVGKHQRYPFVHFRIALLAYRALQVRLDLALLLRAVGESVLPVHR